MAIVDRRKKRILQRLLAKPVPERYSISAPEKDQWHYDFFSVHASTHKEKDLLLQKLDETSGILTCLFWQDADAAPEKITCRIEDVPWETISVKQRFRTWDIRYGSAREAYWHDLLRLPRLRWRWQRIREWFIKPITPDFRMELLRVIVDEHRKGTAITPQFLLEVVHGSRIYLARQIYHHLKDINFFFESLKRSRRTETP